VDSEFDYRDQDIFLAGESTVRQGNGSTIAYRGRNGRLRFARGRKAEGGATLVEFALIVMIFMTMVLGIIDFSRALYTYHFLSNAAREATRWTAVNGYNCNDDGSCNGTAGMNNGPASDTDIEAYVRARTPMGIDASQLTVTVSHPVQTDSPAACATQATQTSTGCTVEVRVSYPFNFVFPFIRSTSLALSSTSEMIIVH
jgi:Flp pilus assembly protein TadG